MYPIVRKETLADNIILMDIKAPRVAKECLPGQFIIAKTDEVGERIPLTICDYDRETDVLSFPNLDFDRPGDFEISEDREADYFDPDTGELILGDIIISVDRIKEQAESYGHSRKREFAFLVAHSMLHLCGYDHMEEGEAKVMEAKQEQVLSSLGITRD